MKTFPLFLLLTTMALPLRAQQTAGDVLTPLEMRGKRVRLRADEARMSGRLLTARDGTATLETTGGMRMFALENIDSVWVRGRSTRTGAVIGGAIGAAFFGVAASVLNASACSDTVCVSAGSAALQGGLFGLVSGAIVGGGIGALIPKWKGRFP